MQLHDLNRIFSFAKLVLPIGIEPTCVQLLFHRLRRARRYGSMNCLNCNRETKNAKYCSKSCSTSHTNRIYCRVKPRVKLRCRICDVEYFAKDWPHARCNECWNTWRNRVSSTTLGDLIEQLNKRGQHPSYRWSEVRSHCRNVANKHREKRCQVCGYARHVDFCHVKPLSSFASDATIAEVNDPKNIVILCKNHHWELDHGVISYVNDEFIFPPDY